MTDQTKQKIAEWVGGIYADPDAIRRTIIFALELAKEAVKDTKSSGCGNPRKCGSACGQCRFHAGFGTGRTKGQRAIQELIDEVKGKGLNGMIGT